MPAMPVPPQCPFDAMMRIERAAFADFAAVVAPSFAQQSFAPAAMADAFAEHWEFEAVTAVVVA